mmetsp:Transcript_28206/g.66154  ORF Transcript_28206/g.66154 Transcript_28206/m.66154 type:complete len:223 (-) Transcript_28206:545-1213(-)
MYLILYNTLGHIRSIQLVAHLAVVMTSSDAGNNQKLLGSMFLPGDSLGFFHEKHAEALMLEPGGVATCNRHGCSVNMQLTYNGGGSLGYLGAEGHRTGLSQAQQSNENVFLWIFICEESLPPTVGYVVSSNQLHIFGVHLLVNLLHADLPCSDILARQIKIPHPGQGEFTQMTMLHTTGHQRHGNVSLDAINTSPWRDHGQYRRRQLDELLRRVVFVPSSLP